MSIHITSKNIYVSLVLLILAVLSQVNAQEFYTPDREINVKLRSGEIEAKYLFGVTENQDGLVINPLLEEKWTWLAAKNLLFNDSRINFFFVDGWLYTDKTIFTQHRRQKFQRNVTDMIESNVFTLAFYSEKVIEKELVIFIASDKEIVAQLKVDKGLWGQEREMSCKLGAGEGHFISLLKMSDEYRSLYIPATKGERKILDLNDNWRFSRGDHPDAHQSDFNADTWENIAIPHSWNRSDVYDTRNEFDGFEEYHAYYRGIGWYRKQFNLDESLRDRNIAIEFEGANQIAEVWLNEHYLGKHIGGYTGFAFEISDYLKFGPAGNLLAVKVDNSYNYDIPPHTADFIMYGGLYRDMRFIITDKIKLHDIIVSIPYLDISVAGTTVKTKIRNSRQAACEISLVTNIINQAGEILSTAKNKFSIVPGLTDYITQDLPPLDTPELWSPDHPSLYTIVSTIYQDGNPLDISRTNFGYRWYRFDPGTGFYLNGQPLKLKGVNKHQDYFGMANAVPDSLQVRDIEIIKDMGANFIRLSHYPHDPSVLDACDRLGILVWEEIPLVNTVGGKKFFENTKQMMREMIKRDKNHPSIILWGVTNESAMPFTNQEQVPVIKQLLQELHNIAKILDPTRLTVQAHNHFKDISIADITDVLGRNRYFGWYEGDITDFGKVMDEEHKNHPDWNIIISEYGVGSKRGYHVENPIAFDFSEEYQLDFHEHYWKIISERPWIAGGAVWNMFDFGSFVKIGNIPRINQKGLCDFSRRPKDAYYLYQSQWTDTPMIYIVSHTRQVIEGTIEESKVIRVYSNCSEVELILNGVSLGKKQDQYVYRWDVQLKPGENVLSALGTRNGITVQDKITTMFKTQ